MKKKILFIIAAFIFSWSYVFAGGSMAPHISAVTMDRQFGLSSDPNNLIIHFCNNDRNSVSETGVRVKLKTIAVKTDGVKPKKKNKKTINYSATVNTDENGCGNATIRVKNGKYNVKIRIKEREHGTRGWWTAWSGYFTTSS